jgi:hypothetical protein
MVGELVRVETHGLLVWSEGRHRDSPRSSSEAVN